MSTETIVLGQWLLNPLAAPAWFGKNIAESLT
jgi:hypothetical protein